MFFAQRYSSIDLNLFKDISKTLPKNLVFVEKKISTALTSNAYQANND
jgi:hypothetical protein